MALPQRIAAFLSLRRSLVGMLLMAVLVTLGEKMGDRFLPIYLEALGGGALAVGLLSGMKNLLSALYAYPGGYAAHHLGYKRALLLFNFLAVVGYGLVILAPSWPVAIAGAALFLAWSAISLPATMDLVARVVPKNKRAMGVSLHSLIRRIPMALGPLLGGYLYDRYGVEAGVRIGFIVAIAMALVAMVAQQLLIADDRPPADGADAATHDPPKKTAARLALPHLAADMSPDLRKLLVSDILIRFCEQIPDAFVVIWCMETIKTLSGGAAVDGTQFGVLTTVEMATAVLCYLPVAHFADRGGKKPFVLLTFVFFSLFPLALLFCRSFWPLVFAFVLRGLKEFGEPTRKSLILDLAPEDRKAAMFGFYYLVRDSVVALAAFGGYLLWQYGGPAANLLTAFGCGVIGTVWFALYGKDVAGETERR